jgi:hypothetical protein
MGDAVIQKNSLPLPLFAVQLRAIILLTNTGINPVYIFARTSIMLRNRKRCR